VASIASAARRAKPTKYETRHLVSYKETEATERILFLRSLRFLLLNRDFHFCVDLPGRGLFRWSGRKASSVLMPPPGAGKQPDGDEEEQKPDEELARFEHQQEQQNNSDQHRSSGQQVMSAEVAEEFFDFIEVHGFLRAMLAS
jgi:hypothetical protein